MDIPEVVWEEAPRRVHKSSISAKLCFIQCNVLHRAHLTKNIKLKYSKMCSLFGIPVNIHLPTILICFGAVPVYIDIDKNFFTHYPQSFVFILSHIHS